MEVVKNIVNANKQLIDEEINGTRTIYDKVSGRGVNVSRSGEFNGFRELQNEKLIKLVRLLKTINLWNGLI